MHHGKCQGGQSERATCASILSVNRTRAASNVVVVDGSVFFFGGVANDDPMRDIERCYPRGQFWGDGTPVAAALGTHVIASRLS